MRRRRMRGNFSIDVGGLFIGSQCGIDALTDVGEGLKIVAPIGLQQLLRCGIGAGDGSRFHLLFGCAELKIVELVKSRTVVA